MGVELRRHIAYQGTTFFGDGVNFIRDVGNIGDRTFTPEANLNSFACTGENAEVCGLLNTFYNSSYEQCQFIEKLYSDCEDTFNLGNIKCEDMKFVFFFCLFYNFYYNIVLFPFLNFYNYYI